MTKTGEYKGNPTITLDPEGKFPFAFGVGKAKLILENLEAIKEFVAQVEKDRATNAERKDVPF